MQKMKQCVVSSQSQHDDPKPLSRKRTWQPTCESRIPDCIPLTVYPCGYLVCRSDGGEIWEVSIPGLSPLIDVQSAAAVVL